MAICAELNEKSTKRIKFKLVFTGLMIIVNLLIYPQLTWYSPYHNFLLPNNESNISVYLMADSVLGANQDLTDIKNSGIGGVVLMPDTEKLNASQIESIVLSAKSIGLLVGLSIGGIFTPNKEYMSQDYMNELTSLVIDLMNTTINETVDLIELLPYINAPDDYGYISGDLAEMFFGSTLNDINFLANLAKIVNDSSNATIRSSVHVSYRTNWRLAIKRINKIAEIDQISVAMFQQLINAEPGVIASGIEDCKYLSSKEVIVGPIGFSTHDDVHSEGMQVNWFWSIMNAVTSSNINEVVLWQWKDRSMFPFIVPETLDSKYGIHLKEIENAISQYQIGNINYMGYTLNLIDIFLSIFSANGSTGIISQNILLAFVIRMVLGILIGRKCKLNAAFLAPIIFGCVIVLHVFTGVIFTLAPNWWFGLFTYLYLYASISAGIFQIQLVSTAVRHNRVFSVCDGSDPDLCVQDFRQDQSRF